MALRVDLRVQGRKKRGILVHIFYRMLLTLTSTELENIKSEFSAIPNVAPDAISITPKPDDTWLVQGTKGFTIEEEPEPGPATIQEEKAKSKPIQTGWKKAWAQN